MKYFILWLMLFFNFPLSAQSANTSGISFNFTRIVYSEKDTKGVIFQARNNTPGPVLIQAWGSHINTETGAVDDSRSDMEVPFIVLPPLQRVESGEEFTLHLRPNATPPPVGKESVWLLSFKTIPVSRGKRDNSLAVTVVTSLKVFIRNGVNGVGVEQAAGQVTAAWGPEGLMLNNPTPYWLTLSSLKLDKRELARTALLKMVAPMRTTTFPWNGGRPQQATLRFIDEYSMDTPLVSLKIK
ncbi:MAG: fimbrial biogenesis chaperone [Kluyvera sp.]|uniref:fimbrial biogenesis chaperone n=1 Tax=Kluyvera sp. TaxID=1538228 RepID=UPI003F3D8A97